MKTKLVLVLISVLFLTSCSTMMSRNRGKVTLSSSLVEFLYPHKRPVAHHSAELPVLKLPVSIGLAFVPTINRHGQAIHNKDQLELLDKVKASFLKYDFIDRIEVIPDNYLSARNGFSTLEQVGRLYNVDLMALVSYDQIAQTFENNAALLYWTIAGMYVIPGNRNSVQTFVDTAVFDIQSRRMLFRAPGISKLSKLSTAVGIDATLSKKSLEGFGVAVTDMTVNLDNELARFKTRVKEEKIAKIEHREGYSGGGSFGPWLIVLLVMMMLTRYLQRPSVFLVGGSCRRDYT